MNTPRQTRRRESRRPPAGSAPGTLALEPGAPPPPIRVLAYGPDRLEEADDPTLRRAGECLGRLPVTWIDIDGVRHEETLASAAALVGLHPLALADAAHTHQRPKVEDYSSYLFIVLRLPHAPPGSGVGAANSGPLQTEQVSLVLRKDCVMTFQEEDRPGDCFEPVRHRIRTSSGRMRSLGADYLAYALMDAAVDAYFPVLEHLGERLDAMEEAALSRPEPAMLHDLHGVRRDLLTIRRAVWPLRDALGGLLRDQNPLIQPETRLFLRDCLDHANQIIDLVETYREVGSSLMEVHLTSISNRMNEIMKVLTIIATIFIPLTFIVGVYGMNFDRSAGPLNMPELGWRFGYVGVWAAMLAIAGSMLWAFRRRGWMGRR